MGRLIDADAIQYTDLNGDHPESKVRVYVAFKENIDRMPTVDAVPVRCKDCEHREFYGLYFLTCERHRMSVDADYYCGDGIREDGGDGSTD